MPIRAGHDSVWNTYDIFVSRDGWAGTWLFVGVFVAAFIALRGCRRVRSA